MKRDPTFMLEPDHIEQISSGFESISQRGLRVSPELKSWIVDGRRTQRLQKQV